MSDCGVCLDAVDSDGAAELYFEHEPLARKGHKCYECATAIHPGERYHVSKGRFDGEWFHTRTCLTCHEIGRALSCGGGYMHGSLWDDIREIIFPDMSVACVGKLSTAAAKAVLLGRWYTWKFAR